MRNHRKFINLNWVRSLRYEKRDQKKERRTRDTWTTNGITKGNSLKTNRSIESWSQNSIWKLKRGFKKTIWIIKERLGGFC